MKYCFIFLIIGLVLGSFGYQFISNPGELIKTDTITTVINHYDTIKIETPVYVTIEKPINIVDSIFIYKTDTIEILSDYFSVKQYDSTIISNDLLTLSTRIKISRNSLLEFGVDYSVKERVKEITNTVERKRNSYYAGLAITTEMQPYAVLGFSPANSKWSYLGIYKPQEKVFGGMVLYKIR